jgi:hypothetical protein
MDEQKIREAAYRLWEKDGKPQGQDLEHWFTAEKSVGEDDADNSTSKSTPSNESEGDFNHGAKPKKKRNVDNLN